MHCADGEEGSVGALEASRDMGQQSSAEEWLAQVDREGLGRRDQDASLRARPWVEGVGRSLGQVSDLRHARAIAADMGRRSWTHH